MASIRETIFALMRAKRDPNGSGSNLKSQSLSQLPTNDEELMAIRDALIAADETFTDQFYNIENETYLVWDYNQQNFVNTITGEDYLIEMLIDDFESGDFTGAPWVLANGGENDWEVGTAAVAEGTYGAYISNDGGTSNVYSSIGGGLDVSHLYIDILMPNATGELILSFDWRSEAESGFDYANVFDVTTGTTPVANTELGAGLVGQSEYNDQSTFVNEQISLPIGEAGTTRRIVFSWRNDNFIENQPPMAIDNVKILYL